MGGWTKIGYIAPNGGETTNFFYGEAEAHNTDSDNAAMVGWAADNRVTLNDCTAGSVVSAKNATGATNGAHWYMNVTVNTGTQADVSFDDNVADACSPLTPSFDKIGK